MLNSAQSILDLYIDTDKVSRFTFYSVQMERGENPEDLYYLCCINDHYYVVFETDYVADTPATIAHEAATIFKSYGLSPLHWMVRKDAQRSIGASTVPIGADDVDGLRASVVSDKVSSPAGYAVRYAVIEFTDTSDRRHHRFDPNAYGSTRRAAP